MGAEVDVDTGSLYLRNVAVDDIIVERRLRKGAACVDNGRTRLTSARRRIRTGNATTESKMGSEIL